MHSKKIFSLFKLLLTGTLYLLIAVGCKKQFERPAWDVDLLAPLVKSSISIRSLVNDSTYKLDTDSSIVLMFKQPLDSFTLKGLNEFQIDPFYKLIRLSSLKLTTDTITQVITLGQIARQLLNSPDQQMRLVGFGILFNHGKTMDIPNFDNIVADAVPFDVSEWFKFAVIKKGNLNISVTNRLPITVANIQFDLSNQTLEPKLVLSTSFSNILPNQTQSKTEVIENKKIEGNLTVNIADLDLTGGTNILIDTNASLNLKIVISDIELEEADAVFPAQNVVVDTVVVPIYMVDGVEAKETVLEKGLVRIKVLSTIQDSLFYTYRIPNAITPQGNPFVITGKVPPSKAGEAVQYEYIADFSGFKLNLTGAPGQDAVNAFYSDFTAAIRYTGIPVFLSLVNDSLEINITMEQLKPSYLRGHIQQDTALTSNSKIDVFKVLKADAINFDKIKMKLDIKSTFGVNIDFTPELLQASNPTSTVALNDPNLIGTTKTIAAATDNPLTATYLQIGTDQAAPLFNIIPQTIDYKMRIKTGRQNNGSEKTYNEFIYKQSTIVPILNIEVPLNFSAKNIVLQDTIALSEQFKKQAFSGKFKMLVKNDFPLRTFIKLKFINAQGITTASLLTTDGIEAGNIEPNTGKVLQPTQSTINYVLTKENMTQIQNADRIIIEAQFDTKPDDSKIKIFDNYKLDIKIIGDINYQVK